MIFSVVFFLFMNLKIKKKLVKIVKFLIILMIKERIKNILFPMNQICVFQEKPQTN